MRRLATCTQTSQTQTNYMLECADASSAASIEVCREYTSAARLPPDPFSYPEYRLL